jgi:hypothetical protein
MSFARKIARKARQDQRVAANLPKSRGKLIKQLRRKGTNPTKHLAQAQQYALWVTAMLINATGAHHIDRVLVDARNPYAQRAIDAWNELNAQQAQGETNDDGV